MKNRIAIWTVIALICTPLVMMIRFPATFTEGIRFVLRYHLELGLLMGIHVLGLSLPFSRRKIRGGQAMFILLCLTSVTAFGYLAYSYTYRAFWGAVVLGCSYGIWSDLLAREGIWAPKKMKAQDVQG